MGRAKRRAERNAGQEERDDEERERIERPDPVEDFTEKPAQAHRRRESGSDSDHSRNHPLDDHQAADPARLRTQGQADPDLLVPPRH